MPFLAGYVTPQDYGALGNNIADDTSAIQSAITALSASGGGTLFFPAGTYKLTAALSLTTANAVSLLGLGPGFSVLNQTSTTANAITYNASGDLTGASIMNMSITGPGSGTGLGIFLQGNSGGGNVVSGSLENVSVSGFGSHNIEIVNAVGCSLDTVNSAASGGHCFFLTGGTGNVLDNCYANGSPATQQGFQLTTVSYTALSGCKASSCGGGYQITGGAAVSLMGCGSNIILAANGQDGSSFKINGGSAHSLISCSSSVNKARAFYVTGSATASSLFNLVESLPSGATASIQVDAGSAAVVAGYNVTTAVSFAAGTTTQLQSGQVIALGPFAAQPSAAGNAILSGNVAGGDAFDRVRVFGSGQIAIGPGTAARDAFFGRAGTATGYANPNFLVGAQTALGDNGSGELQLANVTTAPTTNPVGGGAVYAVNGTPYLRDPNGLVRPMIAGPQLAAMPGSLAETVHRGSVTVVTAQPTSGTLFIQQVYLPAGTSVGHIGFATGTTAAVTPTHWWAALLDNTYKQQAHSADQTSGALAASTWFNLAMVSPFVTTYSGLYYLAAVFVAGTQPSILQASTAPAAQFITGAGVPTPLINGASTTGLTTPGTDGTTVYAAPTAASAPFYLYCAA